LVSMTSANGVETQNSGRARQWLKNLFDRWGLFPDPDEDSDAYWEHYTGMPAAQAVAILRRDMPADTRIAITTKADGTGSIQIYADGQIDDSQEFDLQRQRLGHGELTVEDQGKGLGRYVLRNEIELFRACGFPGFNMHAGFEAGGYAWARFGFLPTNLERATLREPIARRYALVRDLLDSNDRALLDRVAKIEKPADVWTLADADTDIGPQLQALRTGDGPAQDQYNRIMYAIQKTGYDGIKVVGDLRRRLDAGQSVYLGRLLLSGTDWAGYLDFSNQAQMERVGRYIGGWSASPQQSAPVPSPN